MEHSFKITGAAALVVATLSIGAAQAQGLHDGPWTLDATAAGRFDSNQRYQFPPIHLTFTVTNGVVAGSIERPQSYVRQVTNGYDSEALPLTGTLGDDDKVVLKWDDHVATGTAGRHGFEVSWWDECGERVANGRPE